MILEKRGKALENKYFNDETMNFKVISRRRKLLGLWAAELMHLNEQESQEYAKKIVSYGIEDNTEGAVVSLILDDFEENGIEITEDAIREEMENLHFTAAQLIEKEFAGD